MIQQIEATYADGVLKPDQPLDLPDQARVRVTITHPESRSLEERLRAARDFVNWVEGNAITTNGEKFTRDQLHERD